MTLPFVSVIGTVFVDCKGFASQTYLPDNRNLGTIRFVHGGVGRNVAENLARLGVSTRFVSTVDATAMGKDVVRRLEQIGVNTAYLREADNGMGMWLAILDEKGELAGSISQMPDLSAMQDVVRSHGSEIMGQSSHIVLELDLNIEIVNEVLSLARKNRIPVYGLPGNLDVVLQHREILGSLECFICNNFEADLLFQTDFTSLEPERKQLVLQQFVNQTEGLRSMVVTLGANGSVYYDKATGERGCQSVFPVAVVDSSGAGDAFFSGTVMGLIHNLPLSDAVVCGTKVAGWTIEATENICLQLAEKRESDSFFRSVLGKKDVANAAGNQS